MNIDNIQLSSWTHLQSISPIQSSQTRSNIIKIIIITFIILHLILSIWSYLIINNHVLYEGPLQSFLPIHSGEIHYARIPHQYWEHRILMLKAMGLNSLSVYIMWNHHQIKKGVFDFQNNNKNLSKFLDLAYKHNMNVLLRPGPYVCAQWDFGGLPARLLGIQDIKIRSDDQIYQDEVKIYFKAVAQIIKPYLLSQGGPILMIQIQNQLGYIRNQPKHTLNLLQMWKDLQINSEFYYQDPGQLWQNNYWPGAHIALSQSSHIMKYLNIQLSSLRNKNSLIFGGQVYSGWFTDWGQEWSKKQYKQFKNRIQNLLLQNRSFNLYMGYGGTNFGNTAGANGFNILYTYMPHITSYDYDSPISQQGKPTQKYYALRQIFQNFYGQNKLIDIPQQIKTIQINQFQLKLSGQLFNNLDTPIIINDSLTYFQSQYLKMYNQGILIYETNIIYGKYIYKTIIRDYALFYLDQRLIYTFQRRIKETTRIKIQCNNPICRLRVVVQALGHINFGQRQGQDRKGLIQFIDLKNINYNLKWNIYTLSLHNNPPNWNITNPILDNNINLYIGQFNLKQVGDTFFDMKRWGKGYVWINNNSLGRYWNIGPQYRLYCPGVWLKQENNKIIILELLNNNNIIIDSKQTMQ